ncbi:uncharacterized protein [Euwallacea fornicatus]|uniref:uncharacterized protein isoform X2 n=1 Tax=Euwallacea fornicatus TaxID=995702 RepID=UPI00338F9DF7
MEHLDQDAYGFSYRDLLKLHTKRGESDESDQGEIEDSAPVFDWELIKANSINAKDMDMSPEFKNTIVQVQNMHNVEANNSSQKSSSAAPTSLVEGQTCLVGGTSGAAPHKHLDNTYLASASIPTDSTARASFSKYLAAKLLMGDEASAKYYTAATASALTESNSSYNAKCQEIAANMRELMTRAHCYICGVNPGCGLHYGTPDHLSKAVHWVAAMTETRNPHVIAQVFCAPCNTPLIAGDEHYYNVEHKTLIRPNQLGMAIELQHHLTPDKCWLCDHKLHQNDSHYRTKKHLRRVGGWINLHKFRFGLFGFRSWDHLYCECCNAVFIDANWAFRHYESDSHRRNMTLFCNVCRVHFTQGKYLRNHLQLAHGLEVSDHSAFESYAGISWCENFKELLTLDECELCNRLFVNRKEAKNHYHRTDLFDEILKDNPAKTVNSTLKHNVVEELKRVIYQIFMIGTLSCAEALQRLKTLNLSPNDPICPKSELKLCECLSKIVVNSRHPLYLVDTAVQGSAKLNLDMELSRLKKNCKKLAVGVAVRYVRDLKIFILEFNSGQEITDVAEIFSSDAVLEVDTTLHILEEELKVLELLLEINQKTYVSCPTHDLSLVKRKGDIKVGVEVILNIVRKFNAGVIKIICSEITTFCSFCQSLPARPSESTDLHDSNSKILSNASPLWERGSDEAAVGDLNGFRLLMEVAKTKAFLSKANVFPVEVALAYMERFNHFILQVKRKLEVEKINVETVFWPWDNKVTCEVFLHKEMNELYYWLTQCRHYFDLKVALDIIMQFNAGLQSLVDTYNCDVANTDEGAGVDVVNSEIGENSNFTTCTEDHYNVNVEGATSIESIPVNCDVSTNVGKDDNVTAENDNDCPIQDVGIVKVTTIDNGDAGSITVMDNLAEPHVEQPGVADIKNHDINDIIIIEDSVIEDFSNAMIITQNFADIGNDDTKKSTIIGSLADDYKECSSDVAENYEVITTVMADSPIEKVDKVEINMTAMRHKVTDNTNNQTNSSTIMDTLVDVHEANSDIANLQSDNVVMTVIANSEIVETDNTDVGTTTDHDGDDCIGKSDDGSSTFLGDVVIVDIDSDNSAHCDVATTSNDNADIGSDNDWDWTCVGC